MAKRSHLYHKMIPYNPRIEALVRVIGDALAAHMIRTPLPLPIPLPALMPNLKLSWQGTGEYNVSLLLEGALIKTAWDIQRIDHDTLKRYVQFYLDNRSLEANAALAPDPEASHAGERYVELRNEDSVAAVETIARALEDAGFKLSSVNKKDSVRGKVGEVVPNFKATALVALCYCADVLSVQEG
jgi:hypothetical protein